MTTGYMCYDFVKSSIDVATYVLTENVILKIMGNAVSLHYK